MYFRSFSAFARTRLPPFEAQRFSKNNKVFRDLRQKVGLMPCLLEETRGKKTKFDSVPFGLSLLDDRIAVRVVAMTNLGRVVEQYILALRIIRMALLFAVLAMNFRF